MKGEKGNRERRMKKGNIERRKGVRRGSEWKKRKDKGMKEKRRVKREKKEKKEREERNEESDGGSKKEEG